MSIKFKELIDFIKNYGKGRNYKVFLVFVLISTVFWLLIKFSQQYTALVSFPVNYISVPEDMVWGEIIEDDLEISTTASGFQQLSYAWRGKKINIDVSKLRSLGADQFYLLPNEQISSIIQQFPSNLVLTYRSPDTLFFDLSRKIDKRVPVILHDSLFLAKSFQYMDKISIHPDSITLSGPSSIVSKIDNVETLLYAKSGIRESSFDKVGLKKIDNTKVLMSTNFVNIDVRVEKFTQSSLIVPIVIENVPSGYLLKTFPDNVKITFNTGLSNFKSISSSSFRVVADYDKMKQGNNQSIPIEVESLTDKLELIKVEPSAVEFLLREID